MPKKKTRSKHSFLAKWWRRYEYKHTTLAIFMVSSFILAIDTALIQGLLLMVREAGIVGIFLTGVLFVSFLTAGPATLILINIAPDYNPILASLLAGAGSVLGDWIIIRFIEDKVAYELRPLARKYGIMPIIRQMRTRKFRPFAILSAMLIIASPLPDEAGLGLLGLTKTPARRILPIIFILNSGGILLLILAARAVTGA